VAKRKLITLFYSEASKRGFEP